MFRQFWPNPCEFTRVCALELYLFSVSVCEFGWGCFGPWNLILVNSQGFAFWRRSEALYFEGLRGLILVNSRGFAFWRRSEALYFESLRGLILMNSWRFAFWRRSGALYFEDLRSLILVNSRGFAFSLLPPLLSSGAVVGQWWGRGYIY